MIRQQKVVMHTLLSVVTRSSAVSHSVGNSVVSDFPYIFLILLLIRSWTSLLPIFIGNSSVNLTKQSQAIRCFWECQHRTSYAVQIVIFDPSRDGCLHLPQSLMPYLLQLLLLKLLSGVQFSPVNISASVLAARTYMHTYIRKTLLK